MIDEKWYRAGPPVIEALAEHLWRTNGTPGRLPWEDAPDSARVGVRRNAYVMLDIVKEFEPPTPGVSEWCEKMRRLLGKEVRVTVDYEKPTTVEGVLVHFDEGGEVALRREDGFVGWSWPALDVVEL